jgi:uncharacterized repeat protein (TIGR03806 family)
LLAVLLLCAFLGAAAERTPWTSSRITGSPEPPSPYTIEPAFPNLKFDNPVELVRAPGSDRLFVMELNGKVFSFPNRRDVARPDLFADLKADLEGVHQSYGMVFHPGFATNRFVYLCYVLKPKTPDGTRVSRFKVLDTDPPRIDPKSEKILITWLSGGHNGGSLHFGPQDGFLYISTGDAEAPSPPDALDTGQDLSDLLASILRIDVDREDPGRAYRVPPDNPFVDTPGARPENWAYGFRNPWKMAFDPATGALWVGDVGWDVWELVHRVERGGNYGWSIMEGSQPIKPDGQRGPTPIQPPIAQHSHVEARSITGGYVYHGQRLPELAGQYLYADWITGKMWSLPTRIAQPVPREIAHTDIQIICFGVDHADELYVVGYEGGIHRLVPNPATQSPHPFPRRLSETGLFASVPAHQPAPGVVPYRIQTELWADGATAERFVAIPGDGRLGVETRMDRMRGWIRGAWTHPRDAVLAKTLSLELEQGNPATRRRLETQLLHYDGGKWNAYTYVWNDEQTDATLAPPQGDERTFVVQDKAAPGGQRRLDWRFASRTDCLVCHMAKAATVLGFKPQQLDREVHHGGKAENQVQVLERLGLFLEPVKQPKLPKPTHPEIAALERRARDYLHVNCAHCHQTGGASAATIDLNVETAPDRMKLFGAPPTQGLFGIENATLLTPAEPYHSVLLYRMAKLGSGHMPHLGSSLVDADGVRLVRDWIAALPRNAAGHDGSPSDDHQQVRQSLDRLQENAGKDRVAMVAVIDRFLESTSGALALALALDDPARSLPQAVRAAAVARGAGHAAPSVRDLFERFIPDDQRVVKLGTTIQPEQVLSLQGDAARGRKLFFAEGGAQCALCHTVKGEGRSVGPDLSDVGKRLDRAALLRSLTEPSRDIAPEWVVQHVDLRDGTTISGFVIRRTQEEFVIRDATGADQRIPADKVNRLTASQLSLMPEGLLANLTAQEAADLVEFLAALK